MNANPLVSIIIPCYNAERFVGDAIRSALEQTYHPVEVIVIDDGSTDGSLDVIRSFGDAIRWETGPNQGGCAARNTGWRQSKGEFIQFLDADDWLHSDKLEKQVPIAIESGQRTLVFCDARSSSPNWSHPHHRRVDPIDDPVCFMLRGGLQTSAPLHRRQWLEEVGGWNESLPCAQERDLHLRLVAHGVRIQRLQETLYTVRHVGNSVSSSYAKVLKQYRSIAQGVTTILQANESLTDQRRHALAGFLARAGRALLKRRERQHALEAFKFAYELHPSGGVDKAYSPAKRRIVSIIGPEWTERLLSIGGKSELLGES